MEEHTASSTARHCSLNTPSSVQCCGVPAAQPRTPAASAWDSMSDWYVTHMAPATASLHYSMANHLGLLKTGEAYRVVETHCADAQGASLLLASAPCGIATYSVVDFSERMVAAATSRLGDRAQAFVGDSCSLPFPDGSFDRYISNLGLCCVQDVRPLAVPATLSPLMVKRREHRHYIAVDAHRLEENLPKLTAYFVLAAWRRCRCASSVARTIQASSLSAMLLGPSGTLQLLTGTKLSVRARVQRRGARAMAFFSCRQGGASTGQRSAGAGGARYCRWLRVQGGVHDCHPAACAQQPRLCKLRREPAARCKVSCVHR